MIEMQTALAIAGLVVFVIVIIVSYDKYRLSRIRDEEARRQRDSDRAPQLPEDSAVDVDPPQSKVRAILSPKSKPAAEAVPEPVPDPVEEDIAEIEKVVRTPIFGVSAVSVLPEEFVDGPQIEMVARIPGENLVKRDIALGLFRQHEFDLKHPRRLFGLSDPGRIWVSLEQAPPSAQFKELGIAVQLVDRTGPITETELNQFAQLVLRFAEVFGRRFRFSMEIDKALAHARQLDDLCKKYDSLAILNILTRESGFSGAEIDRHAREMGMRLTSKHIYQKTARDSDGLRLLYSMASLYGDGRFDAQNMETSRTGGVTLYMNIPKTRDPGEVFAQMVADARELCRRLNGKLVDQNKRGMTEQGISAITDQIRRIAGEMEREGLVPGGVVASRLF